MDYQKPNDTNVFYQGLSFFINYKKGLRGSLTIEDQSKCVIIPLKSKESSVRELINKEYRSNFEYKGLTTIPWENQETLYHVR